MKFIVLGYTGFIGSKVYDSLKSDSENSVIGISSDEVDLSEVDSYKKLQSIITPNSTLIMCVGVKKQLGDDIDIFEKNIVIIDNFIRAVIAVIPKKIIFISSASVYGEDIAHSSKIDENTLVVNRSYYGMAKHMSELLLDKVCEEIKTRLIILRPPLIYGDGDTSFGYGPTGFLRNAIDGKNIIMWGDGNELREFIYIDDVVNIINQIINSEFEGILNIASGKSYTFSDVIRIIKDNLGLDIKVDSRERSKDKVNHIFSNQLINGVLNELKFTDLESGIKLTHDSMQN
jgi:UDP-glucose 4-epimerase